MQGTWWANARKTWLEEKEKVKAKEQKRRDDMRGLARAYTEDDADAWAAAAESRDKGPTLSSLDREQCLAYLHAVNPRRMRRLRREYIWMQGALKQMGKNPEDARWLL